MKLLIVAKLNPNRPNSPDDHLITSLIEKGVEMWVLTNSALHAKKYEAKGASVRLHHPEAKFSLHSIRLIRKILQEQEIEVLYLMHSKAVANGAMAAIGLPVKVVAYRGAAGIYWHDPTAYLTHFHPRIDVVCCVSDYIKREVAANDPFKNRQYITVHKGISEAWFGEKESIRLEDYNILPAEITIACVANIRKVKGVQYLLEALKSIDANKSFRLLLIGDKTDTPAFKEQIAAAGLSDKVYGLGFRNQIHNWIDTCDIYVQPSLSEGLGKTVMEAMVLGKATIATRSGGPEELIEDGKSGLLVPVKDPQALAKAIDELINNSQKRKALGEEAKERMESVFSLEVYADNMYALFNNLVR